MDLNISFLSQQGYIFDNTKIKILNGIRLINIPPYDINNPTVEIETKIRTNSITSFVENSTVAGLDRFTYILEIDGVLKWWDGLAWVTSNGTYAESSTASDINTNLGTLLSGTSVVGIIIFVHSFDGTTTPELTSLELEYVFQGKPEEEINYCTVWGYAKDKFGNPLTNTLINVQMSKSFEYKDKYFPVYKKSTLTDLDGLFKIDLIETDSILDTNVYYVFDIDGVKTKVYVPDQIECNFNQLTVVN